MPGLVKIGWTEDSPDARARRLSSDTGIPRPFVVAWACGAASPAIERLAHDRLAWCRENARREFFRCDVATAVRAVAACNVPLGARYRPERTPRRAGKGRRALSASETLFALLWAVCRALLRHPAAFYMVVGLLVAVFRPEIPAWVPRGAIFRTATAVEHLH